MKGGNFHPTLAIKVFVYSFGGFYQEMVQYEL